MAAVVFDAMGTLFNLAPLRERLGEAEADAWFERTLHWATLLTWDVQGALSAGYGAVWVNPLRQEWPFPGEAPRESDSLVEAVAATRP